MKKVLLHICCGVCAFGCIERLREEQYYVEGLFFNPNIHPYQEYKKRSDALRHLREAMDINIVEGDYRWRDWFDLCQPYSKEAEGGRRCEKCFAMRLQETFQHARKNNFDYFTTTLSLSSHKNSKLINEIGARIGGNMFLSRDFKKKDGFKRANELANKYSLYRQNYCGCIYSRKHQAATKR